MAGFGPLPSTEARHPVRAAGLFRAGAAGDRSRQEKAGETCDSVGSRGTGCRLSTPPRPSSPVTAHVSVAEGGDAPGPGSARPRGIIRVIVVAGGGKGDDGPRRVTICTPFVLPSCADPPETGRQGQMSGSGSPDLLPANGPYPPTGADSAGWATLKRGLVSPVVLRTHPRSESRRTAARVVEPRAAVRHGPSYPRGGYSFGSGHTLCTRGADPRSGARPQRRILEER